MWFKRSPEPSLLTLADIILDAQATDKWQAIRLVGERLLAAGRVEPAYLEAMVAREQEFTTYIGNGLAIPHGVGSAKAQIIASGLSVAQFPQGLDFGDGNTAYLVIGIAGKGDEHIDLLSRIAVRCEDPAEVKRLAGVKKAEEILKAFA